MVASLTTTLVCSLLGGLERKGGAGGAAVLLLLLTCAATARNCCIGEAFIYARSRTQASHQGMDQMLVNLYKHYQYYTAFSILCNISRTSITNLICSIGYCRVQHITLQKVNGHATMPFHGNIEITLAFVVRTNKKII
jgi:hypothetical protein